MLWYVFSRYTEEIEPELFLDNAFVFKDLDKAFF
jgi:hypothetical protein